MFIVPKAGILIRDPITKKRIPPDGAEVQISNFWNRRLRDGDITIHDQKPENGSDISAETN